MLLVALECVFSLQCSLLKDSLELLKLLCFRWIIAAAVSLLGSQKTYQ